MFIFNAMTKAVPGPKVRLSMKPKFGHMENVKAKASNISNVFSSLTKRLFYLWIGKSILLIILILVFGLIEESYTPLLVIIQQNHKVKNISNSNNENKKIGKAIKIGARILSCLLLYWLICRIISYFSADFEYNGLDISELMDLYTGITSSFVLTKVQLNELNSVVATMLDSKSWNPHDFYHALYLICWTICIIGILIYNGVTDTNDKLVASIETFGYINTVLAGPGLGVVLCCLVFLIIFLKRAIPMELVKQKDIRTIYDLANQKTSADGFYHLLNFNHLPLDISELVPYDPAVFSGDYGSISADVASVLFWILLILFVVTIIADRSQLFYDVIDDNNITIRSQGYGFVFIAIAALIAFGLGVYAFVLSTVLIKENQVTDAVQAKLLDIINNALPTIRDKGPVSEIKNIMYKFGDNGIGRGSSTRIIQPVDIAFYSIRKSDALGNNFQTMSLFMSVIESGERVSLVPHKFHEVLVSGLGIASKVDEDDMVILKALIQAYKIGLIDIRASYTEEEIASFVANVLKVQETNFAIAGLSIYQVYLQMIDYLTPQIYVITGSSGSGKTTLVHALCGIDASLLDRVTIEFEDANGVVHEESIKDYSNLIPLLVKQSPLSLVDIVYNIEQLCLHLSCDQNGVANKQLADEIKEFILEIAGVIDLRNLISNESLTEPLCEIIKRASGGELSRIAVVVGFAIFKSKQKDGLVHPFFLDEILSSLDSATATNVFGFIAAKCSYVDGIKHPIVLVAHHLDSITEILAREKLVAHRIVVHSGNIHIFLYDPAVPSTYRALNSSNNKLMSEVFSDSDSSFIKGDDYYDDDDDDDDEETVDDENEIMDDDFAEEVEAD